MIDPSLKARLLPAELIIKDFIKGEPLCNYEKYMLEFVNKSSYFLEKSNGTPYFPPQSESNGECDCISESYKMDFKLIASKSALQGKSILSFQPVKYSGGLVVTCSPKKTKGEFQATYIYAALRQCSYEKLLLLDANNAKDKADKDILDLLNTLKTQKNLLLFFPYYFSFDKNEHNIDEGINIIIEALYDDFHNAIKYRVNNSSKFDTFMAFNYDGHIVFLKTNENSFDYVDKVELKSSQTYMTLANYVFPPFKI